MRNKLKYKINSLLENQEGTMKEKNKRLAQALGLSEEMTNKIRNYKFGEKSAINTDQLFTIAKYLGVSPKKILRKPPSQKIIKLKKAS